MAIPYMISVMSHDRVGIIADVTGAIKSLHGNLEDLSQTVMKGYFTMLLLATFPDGTEEEALRKALHAVKGLSSFEIGVLPYENTDNAPDDHEDTSNLYILTATGPDDVGLVAALSSYLKLKQINIIDLASKNDQGNYIMMFLVKLPDGTNVGKLKRGLQIAMEKYGLTVELRHQAIFSKTNEI